jgi:hypothetical protein
MDDFFGLFLFVMFVGAIFAGGFYVGYRYRDNLSLEHQKKRRNSRQREVFHDPAPTSASRAEGVE